MNEKFKWLKSKDSTFDNSYQSQGVIDGYSTLNKTNNSVFTMDSLGQTLVLRPSLIYKDQMHYALQWPEELYQDDTTLLNLVQGHLCITPFTHEDYSNPFLSFGNRTDFFSSSPPSIPIVNFNINDKLTVSGFNVIEMENIYFRLSDKSETDIDAVNSIVFKGGVDFYIEAGSHHFLVANNESGGISFENNNNRIQQVNNSSLVISASSFNAGKFGGNYSSEHSMAIKNKSNSCFSLIANYSIELYGAYIESAAQSSIIIKTGYIEVDDSTFSITDSGCIVFIPYDTDYIFDFFGANYPKGMFNFITTKGKPKGKFTVSCKDSNAFCANKMTSDGLFSIDGKIEMNQNRFKFKYSSHVMEISFQF